MAAISFLALILLPFAALAQTHRVGGDCPVLPSHQPADDVAHQPGIDANGWAVAPADLAPSTWAQEFDSVTIDLDVPLSDYTDNPAFDTTAPFSQLRLGQIEVERSGTTTLNGKEIGEGQFFHPDCAPSPR